MYYFIINPNSRSGAGKKVWTDLRQILQTKNVSYEEHFTEYAGHAIELSRRISSSAREQHPVTIIAVGGDGTIQEVLTGLKNPAFIHFGYIPTGSGNDFCRSTGLSRDPKEALMTVLNSDQTLSLNIAELTCQNSTSRFAVSCGIGFDAAVCHEIGISPVKSFMNRFGLGKLAYLLIGVRQLFALPPVSLSVETDAGDRLTFKQVFLTAIMNMKYEGGGFQFCPFADPSDHLLDVIVIEGMRRPKLILCLFLSLFGKHTHFKGVHLLHCTKISVHTPKPLAVHKDGEYAGFQTDFTVSLAKENLQLIIPR